MTFPMSRCSSVDKSMALGIRGHDEPNRSLWRHLASRTNKGPDRQLRVSVASRDVASSQEGRPISAVDKRLAGASFRSAVACENHATIRLLKYRDTHESGRLDTGVQLLFRPCYSVGDFQLCCSSLSSLDK